MFRQNDDITSGAEIIARFASEDLPFFPDIIATFSYTGADQSLLIPAGYNFIQPFAWGAGGGGGIFSNPANGGAGGFASAIIPVISLETLTIIIGQGGIASEAGYFNTAAPVRRYGNGGNPSSTASAFLGYGGGLTGIRRSSTWLLIAGGGGGGGEISSANGGAGGGTNGVDGGNSGGGGGTQSAGGSGSGVGTQGQGGDAPNAGALYRPGGGAGWWGGGSPTSSALGSTSGGGGGSGYAIAGSTDVSLIAGSGTTPGNNGSEYYVGGVGIGGVSNTTPGGNGYMRVRIFA